MIGLGLEETLLQYLRAVGWSVTAAVGFAFGVGIALKVFDYLSTDIDEWEEIKKGNIGVSLILKLKDVDTPSSSIFSSAFPGLTAFTLLKLSISTKSFSELI